MQIDYFCVCRLLCMWWPPWHLPSFLPVAFLPESHGAQWSRVQGAKSGPEGRARPQQHQGGPSGLMILSTSHVLLLNLGRF